MPNMGDVRFDALYCLFKGEPGLRKSTAALSFPRPQYWFSWDQKMDALALPMRKWNIPDADINYDDYKDWSRALTKLEEFQTRCPYRTIIIDSITSCADAINMQTLQIKASGSETGKRIAGIPVNSIEDFNAEDSALKRLIAVTKDINKYHKVNVVLIAHVIQKEMKTSDGKTHMSRTIVTAGKGIAQKIPAYCAEVYHFNIKTGYQAGGDKYALFTTHTGDDFARTSLPLESEIVFHDDPLYDKWMKPAIDKISPKRETQSAPTSPLTPTTDPFKARQQ